MLLRPNDLFIFVGRRPIFSGSSCRVQMIKRVLETTFTKIKLRISSLAAMTRNYEHISPNVIEIDKFFFPGDKSTLGRFAAGCTFASRTILASTISFSLAQSSFEALKSHVV